MSWAGITIRDGLPIAGRRVLPKWIADESLYWCYYDEDLYAGLS